MVFFRYRIKQTEQNKQNQAPRRGVKEIKPQNIVLSRPLQIFLLFQFHKLLLLLVIFL